MALSLQWLRNSRSRHTTDRLRSDGRSDDGLSYPAAVQTRNSLPSRTQPARSSRRPMHRSASLRSTRPSEFCFRKLRRKAPSLWFGSSRRVFRSQDHFSRPTVMAGYSIHGEHSGCGAKGGTRTAREAQIAMSATMSRIPRRTRDEHWAGTWMRSGATGPASSSPNRLTPCSKAICRHAYSFTTTLPKCELVRR